MSRIEFTDGTLRDIRDTSQLSPTDAEFVRVTLSDPPAVMGDDEWHVENNSRFQPGRIIVTSTGLVVAHAYNADEAAQIVREHNAHRKLVEALRDLTTAAAALDNSLHAGFKVSELSTEQSQVYNAVNTAKAVLAEAQS